MELRSEPNNDQAQYQAEYWNCPETEHWLVHKHRDKPRLAPSRTGSSRWLVAVCNAVGDRWFVDETYLKVGGRWRYLYRAVDQFGHVIDVYLLLRRDAAAARRFFHRALGTTKVAPVEVTDKAAVYLRVLEELVPTA